MVCSSSCFYLRDKFESVEINELCSKIERNKANVCLVEFPLSTRVSRRANNYFKRKVETINLEFQTSENILKIYLFSGIIILASIIVLKLSCKFTIRRTCISALSAFLLYAVDYEIRKLTLRDGVETTLVHWKGLDGSQPLYIDFHYKEDRMFWADAHSLHRAFLNGSGK